MMAIILASLMLALLAGTFYGGWVIFGMIRSGSRGVPDPATRHVIDASFDSGNGHNSVRLTTHTRDAQAHARAFIPTSPRK